MPERPLILFAEPALADKENQNGRSGNFSKPTFQRQVTRLSPKFELLQSALDQGNVRMTETATAIEPEYTLVFETAGNPEGFYTAIKNLQKTYPNVEWLLELAGKAPNTEDFYMVDRHGNRDDSKELPTKIFCVLTNQRALTQILSLWNHFKVDSAYKFPHGLTGFKHLFLTLNDIHQWGVQERLEDTGVLDDWRVDLLDANRTMVNAQIELFYRSSAEKRNFAEAKLRQLINNSGGAVLQVSTIPEIRYHAILASIPRNYAEIIINRQEPELVLADEIMFIKASGQSLAVYSGGISTESIDASLPDTIIDDPIIALFDGMPQENHPLLSNLISVDDPDDFASMSPVTCRVHGTSMASLILRGQSMFGSVEQIRKIYVRPIMKSRLLFSGDTEDYIPDDFLIVDKIYECVRRLFETTAGAVAPTVRIINLSIGISFREYYNLISPLARLLDWLSYKYRVLFVVSAGNHPDELDLGTTYSDFSILDNHEKDCHIAKYISDNSRRLRLLSPAESMNALTVGASFADQNDSTPLPNQTTPCSDGFPAAYSSFGRGINNAIKPDILFPGGRNYISQSYHGSNYATWRSSFTRAPGILSAYPSEARSGNALIAYSTGTSNSAALISNKATECYGILNSVFLSETGDNIPYTHAAVLLKAMLTHGASWGRNQTAFIEALGLSGTQMKNELHRYLGYGEANVDKVKECAKNQVTLIGFGDIHQNEAFVYSLPLPFDFHIRKYKRKLTVTLAYLSPVHPESMKYREKQVWFTIDNSKVMGTRSEYDYRAVQRGTLQHEIFESEAIEVWDENSPLRIKVNCRGDASDKSQDISIPYALFTTFEMAEEYDVDVYQKVVDKVHIRNPIIPSAE